METITSPSGDTLSVHGTVIEVDTQVADITFELSEEDRLATVKALLGDAPPLDEAVAEDFASKSDGELRFLAQRAVEQLEKRRAEILSKSREEEQAIRKRERARIRQIHLLEQSYLSTQTGRRAQSTQASQNIAAKMYDAGVRFPDPEEGSDQQ